MNKNLRELLGEIQQLEAKVAARLRRNEKKFLFSILNHKVTFHPTARDEHRASQMGVLRYLATTPFISLLTSPVIYGFIVPALILDASVLAYQALVFPVYGIPKARRSEYISLDRGQLLYLNWLERINCDYCAYVNGLVAFTREVASRTEQYFCPIRHAIRTLGLHPRHNYFLPFGDAIHYHAKLGRLRAQLLKAAQ